MCRRIIFAVLLLLIPSFVVGVTTGKIKGRVIAKDTENPLPGVNVIIIGTAYGAATDINGEFFILNVPVGIHSIKAVMMGYKSTIIKEIYVRTGLTTVSNFDLEPTILEFDETIIVVADRPLIQRDLTASRTITTSKDIENMSVDDFEDVIAKAAGVVVDEENEMHFRGGRDGEIAYLLDNSTNIMDPMQGSFDTDIPELAIEETSVTTGGFDAEYGNAQSGIINVVTKDGGFKFAGSLKYTTSALDGFLSTIRSDEVIENRHNPEFSFSGPIPFLKSFGVPGDLRFLVSGWYVNTDTRFINQHRESMNFLGKITYKITPNHTLRIKGLLSGTNRDYFDEEDEYGTLWKVPTVEDLNEKFKPFGDKDGDGIDDNSSFIGSDPVTGKWYGNGILDTEDKNGNNYLDPGEDLNGNEILDKEDLNHNGSLDIFSMLDHLADIKEKSNQIAITWTHNLSSRTFYEIHLDRYYTRYFQNAKETINEDRDGDGHLDGLSENVDINGDGRIEEWEWRDFDDDKFFDRIAEDLNGNGALDPYGTDLFTDWNSDGYVDASQDAYPDDSDKWMSTSDIPYKGEKNSDGFYSYGSGLTWDRRYWYLDEAINYGLKFDLESQVNKYHNIRTGIDLKYREIFRYDATDRYGYGEKFKIFPNTGAFYIRDKMEFQGMILNIGMRYDYFNANWDNYPKNEKDPTWSSDDKGFEDLNGNGRLDEGEDTNGNGYLDQSWDKDLYNYEGAPKLGNIKDPKSIKYKYYFSPRFGISFPISIRSKLIFNYGVYAQEPLGNYLFRNLEFDLGGGFPIIGNPNLRPEQTTSYEFGVENLISNTSKLTIRGFYKDIIDLTDTRPIYFTVRDWYGFYYNSDYGNVRGFELIIERRPSMLGFFQLGYIINYTYQVAKGKSSETAQGYLTEWAGNVLPTIESYIDWDQRHTINANVNFRIPENQNLLGTSLFNDVMANFYFYFGSGTRWTPPAGQDKAALENTETLPHVMTLDFKVSKRFRIGRIRPLLFLDIRNVFDRKNIIAIADEEWYHAMKDPQGKYQNPTVFDRGRLTRLGIKIDF
jgi:outer membrane receptor protein involved in Fe transport